MPLNSSLIPSVANSASIGTKTTTRRKTKRRSSSSMKTFLKTTKNT
jgi:hypothetical protein